MKDFKIIIEDKFTILEDDYIYISNELVDFLKEFETFGDIVSTMIIYELTNAKKIIIDIKQLEEFFVFYIDFMTSIASMDNYYYEINKELVNDKFYEILKELVNKGYAESCSK